MKQFTFNIPTPTDIADAVSRKASQAKQAVTPKPKPLRLVDHFEDQRIAVFLKENPRATFKQYLAYRAKIEGPLD